ncbi:MAG TPA: IS481 family transposase, partial [Nitrospirae bacterium]|nr:IS481 family transposase [Nitrospirota bacterium]
MDQRVRFISEYLEGYFPVAEICRQFNISRKTGYEWLTRYEKYGALGLEDRHRKPKKCPHKTETRIVNSIKYYRSKHPTWGPKKILALLEKRHSDWKNPAESTIAGILKREGLITGPKRRIRRKHPGCPTTVATEPNQIWTADYKGQFKMLNGKYCYPLTVCDMYSRYLLDCDGHKSISRKKTKECFTKLFREYGLPQRIRTDNGVPFASNAIGRVSSLSVWWIRLGIYPELIEPGQPQQNGKHERMHRTLKKETTIPPERNLKEQQQRFNMFQNEYNKKRPHEALGMKTPSELYTESKREMPLKLGHWDYPYHFKVRRVSRTGAIRWQNQRVPVTHTLVEEYIGFEEIDDGVYNVYYCDFLLGRFYEELGRVKDIIERIPIRNRVTKES